MRPGAQLWWMLEEPGRNLTIYAPIRLEKAVHGRTFPVDNQAFQLAAQYALPQTPNGSRNNT
jgi:hypothetical protein